jgi:hypothetical protein
MPTSDMGGKSLPLPASSGGRTRRSYHRLAYIALGALVFLAWWNFSGTYADDDHSNTKPPHWKKMREYERNLPQHNLSLPFPEGRHGRYVRFNNQIRGLGWNNVLNEMCVAPSICWSYKC